MWIYLFLVVIAVIGLRTTPSRLSPFRTLMVVSVLLVGFESIRHNLF